MANKYEEDEIITLDFDDGESVDFGIIGIFDVEGKDYIALEALDGSDEICLYRCIEQGEDLQILNIEDEQTFDKVVAEFESLMDEPL